METLTPTTAGLEHEATFPATLESLRRRDLVQTLRIGAFLACMWALAIALGAAAWGMA